MFRMPTAFGNSPGPRSDLHGERFDWSAARRTSVAWQCSFDEEVAARMLPPRVSVRRAPALLEFQRLENLPWLAGRGYSLFSAKLPVVFETPNGAPRDMMFLLVMFENLADPIITGREELGFSKVFADLAWVHEGDTLNGGVASWGGTEFFRFELGAAASVVDASAPVEVLHYRYVPAIGDWGKPLAIQFVCSPVSGGHPALRLARQSIRFKVTPAPWEALPTLSHIVRGLADLRFSGESTAAVAVFAGGADHYGQKVLP